MMLQPFSTQQLLCIQSFFLRVKSLHGLTLLMLSPLELFPFTNGLPWIPQMPSLIMFLPHSVCSLSIAWML
jgi:hypothetical protein